MNTGEKHQDAQGGNVSRGVFSDAATPEQRAGIIADLRALAVFLEEHPGLPLSPYTSVDVTYFPLTDTEAEAFTEVAEVGAQMGCVPVWEGEHYVVGHACGAGHYRAVAIPEQARASYRAWLTYTGNVRPD